MGITSFTSHEMQIVGKNVKSQSGLCSPTARTSGKCENLKYFGGKTQNKSSYQQCQ